MNKIISQTKIYVVEIGYNKWFCESEAKALELWKLLDSGDFYNLGTRAAKNSGYDPVEEKIFCFREYTYRPFKFYSRKIYLYPTKSAAIRSCQNYDRAQKMKLISKKKKKS